MPELRRLPIGAQVGNLPNILKLTPLKLAHYPSVVRGGMLDVSSIAVPAERIVAVLLPLLIASVAFYFVLHRHRCAHKDPLCRRSRPCIACYRELYYGRKEGR